MLQVVTLSGFTIWFWGLVLVRSFYLYIIVHSLYKNRYNSPTTLLMSFAFTLLYETVSYNFTYFPVDDVDPNYIFSRILTHISIVAFTVLATEKATLKKTVFKCIFVDFLTMCINLLSGLINIFLIRNLNPDMAVFCDSLKYDEWLIPEFFMVSVLSLVISYLIVFFVKLFKVNSKSTFQLKYLYFYLVPIISIVPTISSFVFSDETLSNTYGNEQFFTNQTFANIQLISFAISLIIAIATIFFIDAIQKSDEKMKKLIETVAKNEMDLKRVEYINDENEQTRKLRHDIKNILTMANSFIENGKIDKAKELINQAANELSSVSGVPLCRNEIINTAFYIKSSEANQCGIALKIDIDENNDAHINDLDLSRIILNLCDNAINAAKECDNKTVNINIDIGDKLIKINTSNHYVKKKKIVEFGHGNGEKIIAEIAKKYGGKYESTATDDMYKTSTILRNIELV